MYKSLGRLAVGNTEYAVVDLSTLSRHAPALRRMPFCLRVLVENLLRYEDHPVLGRDAHAAIEAMLHWDAAAEPSIEIAFNPARVLLQDFTGVPAVVDLAAMRDAAAAFGHDPQQINSLRPADLVIDHSVQVDHFGSADALAKNTALEVARNGERYRFLRWGQKALHGFRVVPPGSGIVHQVNLEHLAKVVMLEQGGLAYPDTVVGTDSHTTMVNALGVLGWGVGGIEAEAAMLGQPVSMLVPQVVGVRLCGELSPGVTATDLVLAIVELLRRHGVVGKFVEFFGPGLSSLSLADRATIANMAPEYGATIGFFPIDHLTLAYLTFTGRPASHVHLVETFARRQGLYYQPNKPEPEYSAVVPVDLGSIVPAIAGPGRPQDRILLTQAKESVRHVLRERFKRDTNEEHPVEAAGERFALKNGAVVLAAITSCTNTSNPAVMLAAGMLAERAVARGLSTKPWVKTSLAPGSLVVTDYLQAAGLLEPLQKLGFYVVGYGCTTCIGNSGPLPEPVAASIAKNDLVVAAVLSGNRNFEGRINPAVRLSYLASPPLVVAYALAGTVDFDFATEPLGTDHDGEPVFLKDLWPTAGEVQVRGHNHVLATQFEKRYGALAQGDAAWQALAAPEGDRFEWDAASTYVRRPPYFDAMSLSPPKLTGIQGARVLALFGDSVTTDHISPAGSIAKDSPAAKYLAAHGVAPADFNAYGARRGNHEVMRRGTFANVRLKNLLVPGVEGGVTRHFPSGEQLSIFDAAERYAADKTPLIVIAGAEYGTGSSRDWAAKGPQLLGVRAVVAKSFERIHRSNLVGMGILPLQFEAGTDAASLGLTGAEAFDFDGLTSSLAPKQQVGVTATAADGKRTAFTTVLRIDTAQELEYYRHGGILPYVLRGILQGSAGSKA